MNIMKGDGYDKLCPFLDCDIEHDKFPHANKAPGNRIAADKSSINF